MNWLPLALTGSLLTAIAIVIQKRALKTEHALQHALIIALTQMILSLLLLPFAKFQMVDLVTGFLILLTAVMNAGATILQAKAFRHLEISLTAPLYAIGTVLLVVFAAIFLGEHLKNIQYAGIVAVLIGAYFVDFRNHDVLGPLKDLFRQKYISYSLLSVIGYSAAYFFARPIVANFDPAALLVIQNYVGGAILLIYAGGKYRLFDDISSAIRSDGIWLAIIGVAILAQSLLVLWALKLADVSLVIPVYRTWILGVVLIGGQLFHEHNLKYRLFGAAIMIVGAAIIINPGLLRFLTP